MYFLFLVWSRN